MPFPIENRSDSLTVDWFQVSREVGNALGLGRDRALWGDEEREVVQEIIDEGVRSYLYPSAIDKPYNVPNDVHEWSFMRPLYQMLTATDQREYDLPENFDYMLGEVTFVDDDNDYYGPLRQMSAERLRMLYNTERTTAVPRVCAVRSEPSTGDGPQRQILILHPTPDSEYDLHFQYQATGIRLDEDHPYPPGGQKHSSGFLASCLAAAEMRMTGQQGPAYRRYMELVTANIERDRERGAQFLGYNGNLRGSIMGRGEARRLGFIFYNDTTVGGQLYSG